MIKLSETKTLVIPEEQYNYLHKEIKRLDKGTKLQKEYITQLEEENEALGKILERLADWIERINDDPLGVLTDGYPSPEKMIVYLRQRAWEVNLLDALLTEEKPETPISDVPITP